MLPHLIHFVLFYFQLLTVDGSYKVDLEFTNSEAEVERERDEIVRCIHKLFSSFYLFKLYICRVFVCELVFSLIADLSVRLQRPPVLLFKLLQSGKSLLQNRGKFCVSSPLNIKHHTSTYSP